MVEQIRQSVRRIGWADEAKLEAEYPGFRRNYALGITNGVLFNNGLSFFNRTTIIPVFLSILGAPSLVISLIALLEVIGWHLPQLFASKYVVHKPLKLPLYGRAAMLRLVGLVLAVAGAAVAETAGHTVALLLFIAGYGAFAMAGGFAGLVFTEILAKTVPKEKRGSYFGWRAILSGLVGLGLGVGVITPILTTYPFPLGYVFAFSIGTVLIALGFFLFTRQREPHQENLPAPRTLRIHLGNAARILREDLAFRRFILFRGLAMLWFAGLPFYMLFARDRLGAGEEQIGLFISWEFAGMILANVVWSFISNRIGNRMLLIVSCAMAFGVSILALCFDQGMLPAWGFGAVFLLSAAIDSGVGTGGINYALEIVPEAERPTYIGLMNTLLAGALLVAALAGVLRDAFGYTGLFIFTAGVALVALMMILRLPEPRVEWKGKR